jgi:hypothetical protein
MSYPEHGAPNYAEIRRVKSAKDRGKKWAPYQKKGASEKTGNATEKTVGTETSCAAREFVLESLHLSALADKEASEDAFALADTSLAVDSGVSDGVVDSTVVVDTGTAVERIDPIQSIQTKTKRIWE